MYNPTKPYKHKILQLIESTWETPYLKVERGLYPVFKKKFGAWEVQHTDGIGTKGFYHWKQRTFKRAVQDALAMNLNDLAMVGATPYAIQNHIVLPEDDHKAILAIVGELARDCKKRNIAMTGGETSIHSDSKSMDISITVSAFVLQRRKNLCKAGDVLIGFPSSGLHSNGITKIREVFGVKYREEFTKPTSIYLESVLALLKKYRINGMMHITGGGFTKLKDILGNADAHISQPKKLGPQKIFRDLYAMNIPDRVLYSTFNCGVGFVLSVPPETVPAVLSEVRNAAVLGSVSPGTGKVQIRSAFSQRAFVL